MTERGGAPASKRKRVCYQIEYIIHIYKTCVFLIDYYLFFKHCFQISPPAHSRKTSHSGSDRNKTRKRSSSGSGSSDSSASDTDSSYSSSTDTSKDKTPTPRKTREKIVVERKVSSKKGMVLSYFYKLNFQ